MGVSPNLDDIDEYDQLLVSLKGIVLQNQEMISRRSRWQVIRKRRAKRIKNGGQLRSKMVMRRILMKRRRGAKSGIERRVRTLKKLIPAESEYMGLDGLFRETADYILSLQMKVRVMQIMVQALTGSSSDGVKN